MWLLMPGLTGPIGFEITFDRLTEELGENSYFRLSGRLLSMRMNLAHGHPVWSFASPRFLVWEGRTRGPWQHILTQ